MKQKQNRLFFFGVLLILIAILAYSLIDQRKEEDVMQKIEKFRREKDEAFKYRDDSPIENREAFSHLNYFPPNVQYRIKARWVPVDENEADFLVQMTDSTFDRLRSVAYAFFEYEGKEYQLLLFEKEDNAGYWFLPFKDASNGKETYEGGRYLDVEKPKGNTLILDFNFAYNPYCAYSPDYSCPIPPKQNHLDFAILAGEKKFVTADSSSTSKP
ncbi:DUF1684 domain-containing protein [Thermonema rossianum]|jgi:hypothetical protein|uniref:DUF1684 domain-containing protein n=1 Tax=Thermonema rossianum TaxID=55505 RepID=UPI000571B8D9|nr:DUF1684 domain-containing protein [Thermonema rossianum]